MPRPSLTHPILCYPKGDLSSLPQLSVVVAPDLTQPELSPRKGLLTLLLTSRTAPYPTLFPPDSVRPTSRPGLPCTLTSRQAPPSQSPQCSPEGSCKRTESPRPKPRREGPSVGGRQGELSSAPRTRAPPALPRPLPLIPSR